MTDNNDLYEERIKETEPDSSELRAEELQSSEQYSTEKNTVETRNVDHDWRRADIQQSTRSVQDNGQLACLRPDEVEELRSRWNSIQTRFIDDPHSTVRQADELVSETLQRIQQSFSDQRTDLENQLHNKQEPSTEDLRLGLQSYRSFFNRLLDL